MAIDWFTIGAQILNFLVLIYLLKRFLYRPVLDAIAAREKRIAGTLAEAAAMKAEALKEREALHARNDAFDRDRTTLFAKATEAADGERKRVIEAARVAADALGEKQRQALARDARSMGDDIGRSARTEVFAIARKALADMADESLEARMTAIFIARLAALDASAKRAASGMLDTANGPAVIRSAFALPAPQQVAIRQALDAAFATKVAITFETAPELVGGIELVGGGEKLAWSLSDYLKTLEKAVTDVLSAKPPETIAATT
ncbi:MAG: F0F1 ATP synthase subunit B [Fulvimarina sp.]|nr:F0F1 ATP synthase subunit B [Fulvimarina sp.]